MMPAIPKCYAVSGLVWKMKSVGYQPDPNTVPIQGRCLWLDCLTHSAATPPSADSTLPDSSAEPEPFRFCGAPSANRNVIVPSPLSTTDFTRAEYPASRAAA